MRHLIFGSSRSFRQFTEERNLDRSIEFLPEQKFIRAISAFLLEHLKYRVQLAPEQFVELGFTERKMVLVLDLYDLIKSVKKQTKVATKLTMKDTKWEHPCDVAVHDYAVIDHTSMVQRQMQYNCNATLLKTNLTVKETKSIADAPEEQQASEKGNNCDCKDEQGSRNQKPQVYSITNHFVQAKLNTSTMDEQSHRNDNQSAKPLPMINRGEKMGTSHEKTQTFTRVTAKADNAARTENTVKAESTIRNDAESIGRTEAFRNEYVAEFGTTTEADMRESTRAEETKGQVDDQAQVLTMLTMVSSDLVLFYAEHHTTEWQVRADGF